MANPIGTCGLCRELKPLQDSHLLPAAIYKQSRESALPNPNPVVVTARGARATSRQVSDRFLCEDCEQLLSRNGERYVLSQCVRADGQFALRESLRSIPSVDTDSRLRVSYHDVSGHLGQHISSYLFFAASVFWRASAHDWTFEGRPIERLSIGDTYQEEFRRYLLSKAAWPANARLFVHVWNDERVDVTTVFPCSTRVETARRHKFCIPGILFVLFLGENVIRDHDAGALNSSVGNFMWLCPWRNDSLFTGFAELIAASRGRFNRAMLSPGGPTP